jgi:hypothetical protein
MIGKISNIVARNDKEITVFYTISDDTFLLDETCHFSNTVPFNEILEYIDNRKVQIENRPEPDYQVLIGEVIE